MESPAGRLLTLLSLLQSRPRWNAEELAERLAVTARTVRRDMARLRELGYPVEAAPGPTGGYQLGPGAALPPLLLTDDEAVAVTIGLRAAVDLAVADLEDAAVAALAKLEQVLPARLRDRVGALHMATILVRPARANRVSPDLLLLLAQGCRGLERLRFAYTDNEGRVTDRRVEPYRLVNVRSRWYLVAMDNDRDAWRTFRVDRIESAVLTGHRFTRIEAPDARKLVTDGLASAPYHEWVADVLVEADPASVADVIPPTVGSLGPEGGRTLLRLGGNDLGWMAGYLASLPFEFEVRDPPELRTRLRALGRRLQRHHR